ncbi:MAG: GGDEF domain-containing protein, partial [Limnochordia bacterium]|nr:GGDEF domain-containing protein [Limnochordia bacterium]
LIIDEMTGAYNFRYLNNWLNNPSDDELSLLFIDIDDFAGFNNTYGHAEGDKVLARLVETINGSIRADDQVIRYGGDEFVVFLRKMDSKGAKSVAERIMQNLSRVSNPAWAQPITVSLGIAVKPKHTRDKRELLLFADQAMYRAKNLGKSQIQMWNIVNDSA